MHFDVTIEGVAELQREWDRLFLGKLRREVRKALQRTLDAAVSVAKSHVNIGTSPGRTGTHLRDEIYGHITGEVAGGIPALEGEIVADKPYAKFVEGGTASHIVRPRSGKWSESSLLKAGFRAPKGRTKLLAWQGAGGEWHHAREVTIPAIPAHPFMGPAYIKAENMLPAQLELAVEAAVNAFNATTK